METYYKDDLSDATDIYVDKDGMKGHCTFSKVQIPAPFIGRVGCRKSYTTIIPTLFKVVMVLRAAEPHSWFKRLSTEKSGYLMISLIMNVKYSNHYYHHYLPHVTITRDTILLPSPIRFEAEVVHFGKNSARVSYKAFTTGQEPKGLFTNTDVICRLDKDSRKPQNIIRWLNINPDDCPKLERPQQFLFRTMPPNCRPRMAFDTNDRDVDHNGHINAHAYMAFFDICLEKELEKGTLPSFRGIQLDSLIVKDFRIRYFNESFPGETLDCYIWIEPENVYVINGELKSGDKAITQCRLDCKMDHNSHL